MCSDCLADMIREVVSKHNENNLEKCLIEAQDIKIDRTYQERPSDISAYKHLTFEQYEEYKQKRHEIENKYSLAARHIDTSDRKKFGELLEVNANEHNTEQDKLKSEYNIPMS